MRAVDAVEAKTIGQSIQPNHPVPHDLIRALHHQKMIKLPEARATYVFVTSQSLATHLQPPMPVRPAHLRTDSRSNRSVQSSERLSTTPTRGSSAITRASIATHALAKNTTVVTAYFSDILRIPRDPHGFIWRETQGTASPIWDMREQTAAVICRNSVLCSDVGLTTLLLSHRSEFYTFCLLANFQDRVRGHLNGAANC